MKQGQIRPFRRTRPVPIRRGATGSFVHSRAFGAGFFPPFGFGSFFLRCFLDEVRTLYEQNPQNFDD